MKLFFAPKRLARSVPLAVATVVVGVGACFVGYSAIGDMQRSHAEYAARSFAAYLIDEIPGLDVMIAGGRSPQVTSAMIKAVRPIGSVYAFHLFDLNGQPVDGSTFGTGQGAHLAADGAEIARTVLETGRPAVKLAEGSGDAPRYFADVTIPLRDGDRVIGALSLLSDETESWPALFEQFRTVLLQILALALVAFAIPGILYLGKTKQLAKTTKTLRHSTQYDELTGCLNRTTFTSIVNDLVTGADSRGLAVAVHVVDLDRFKDVNESRGHAVGDELLKAAAQRLHKLMGTRERIARIGADEFAICQPYYVNSAQVVGELAGQIVKALNQPFALSDGPLRVSASVGYALYPHDGVSVPELLRAADIAIHQAKERNKGGALAFDRSMEEQRQRRQRIEALLRSALVDNGFEIHFQPLRETASGRLRGFEALLRMNDEHGKPISPAEFIPIAEQVGLIADIGRHVLRESCRMARQWPDPLVVSVNLSPAQFAQCGMSNEVREVLGWSGLPPRRLELEVTESLLITDTEKVLAELMAIKALGVSIALDDFGTGYSSLSYLWRFPFDKLKVDKSFMTDLALEGSKSREILSTIIALGKVLDLKVTAEGVETEQQAQVLRELNCDLVQGYLFGRPMRAIDVAATVMRDAATDVQAPRDARAA